MREGIQRQLQTACERLEELGLAMSAPEAADNSQQWQQLAREYGQLEPMVQLYQRWQQTQRDLHDALDMCQSRDAELRGMAEDEAQQARQQMQQLESELQVLLLPKDPNDERNVFLEVRAGTGGDEAAIFAGDLLRMYLRFAEQRGWRVEMISESHGEHGGYKEVIARVIGQGAYSQLKFESGTHRVQRVPVTESQGRIHTSACTVAILPEAEAATAVDINPADLRVDTYRASGAGGQHVNKTDSAVRLTHLPSGIVVECQDERSQHKNRAKALALLQARLLQAEQAQQQSEQAQERKLQVGSGDRSQRIRTYNFPQGRITDHRINLTLYKLEDILAGDLDQLLQPLQQEHQAELLAGLTAN
ncbi:MAG: peptide chain release factor 1 [Wenzhouxiangellaceae bacterium]